MELYILDRWEGEFAVVEVSCGEDISFLNVQRSQLPANAQEGDVLTYLPEQGWQIDQQATQQRREALRARFSKRPHPAAD